MTRASFTIRTKNGIGYDAAMIMPVYEDHTMRPMVAFVCSGRMQTVPAEDIESVTFDGSGASWCGHCDQPLPQTVVQG